MRRRWLTTSATAALAACLAGIALAQEPAATRPEPAPLLELPLPDYPAAQPVIDVTSIEDLIRSMAPPPGDIPVLAIAPAEALRPSVAEAPAARPEASTPEPGTTAQARSEAAPAAPGEPVLAEVSPAPPAMQDVPLPGYPLQTAIFPNAPVAAALREIAASGPLALSQGLVLSRRDREAVMAFYAARDFEPLWLDAGALTPAGRSIARHLEAAEQDGLDPSSYPVSVPAPQSSPALLAQAELGLSAAAFAYARDARGGRLQPSRLSNLLTPDLDLPEPEPVLAALSSSSDPATVLASYQPRHPGYLALRRKLAELRETTASVTPQKPSLTGGPVLTVGMKDARVPVLRETLGLPAGEDIVYDDGLAEAVKSIQRSRKIPATGRFDARTAAALEGPRASGFLLADIVANMERWRWLPQDLGDRHIFVNLPEFMLRLVEDGREIHKARVIIGKTETQTPVFSHAIDHVVVNPYWNIPPSILRKEVLPGLAADPDWAAKRGYEVIRRGNSISVRQPPGERNALGFIKFMFPNQHAVYLHDTPKRSLFATERRAYSHGCVRVDQPFRLAEFVLGEQGYTEERMRGMIGKGERTIRLKTPLPVHLAYFTIAVDEMGRLRQIDDLYGHDGRIKTALGLGADGRRYAGLRRNAQQ